MKHLIFCASFTAYLVFLVMLIDARLGDVLGSLIQATRIFVK